MHDPPGREDVPSHGRLRYWVGGLVTGLGAFAFLLSRAHSTTLPVRLGRAIQLALLAGVLAAASVLAGVATARSPRLSQAMAVVFFLGVLCLRAPLFPVLAVLPALYASSRVGPAVLNLSAADATLLVGSLAALSFVRWNSRGLRRCLAGVVAYQAILILAVADHPTQRALFEWAHRILLVVGALVVGAVIARFGRTGVAVAWYVAASAAVAVAACLFAATRGFAPAYPFGIQKNSAGLLLACAFLATVVAPREVAVPVRFVGPLRVLLLLGVLASQSRGAMLAVIAGLASGVLRGRSSVRAPVVILAGLAMAAVVVAINAQQAERTRRDPTSARHYGAGAREVIYSEALTIWSNQPALGAGLRYFNDPILQTGEPHNIVVVTLAESGAIGLAALLVLLVAGWSAIRRLPGEIAALARMVFVVRLIAALFDIYWVAGRGSLPWVFVGMAVGADAHRRSAPERRAISA